MGSKLLLAGLCALSVVLHAQINYDANWIMDENSGVTYQLSPSNFTPPPNMDVQEGNAIVSNGNTIILHTDGVDVYDASGSIMSNGYNIGGHLSSSQIVATQLPGSDSLFYIFTLNDYSTTQDFRYTIVDMSQNGGLGAVTSKGNLIGTGYTEKMTACIHDNCTDVWIITQVCGTNRYEARLLTSSGLSSPVISSVGSSTLTYCIGCMKASPDKAKIAVTEFDGSGYVEVFDFDNATGQLSNPVQYAASDPYGVEFSPNSNLVYYTERKFNGRIRQIDLGSGTVYNLGAISNLSQIGGQIQLAKDGNIYGISAFSNRMFGVENPNGVGAAATYNNNAHTLSSGTSTRLGVPQNIQPCGAFFLAVEWLSVEGWVTDEHTFIEWQVEEHESDYYALQRLNAMDHFETIATLPATGHKRYTYRLDYNQAALYRIVEYDLNGKQDISPLIEVRQATAVIRQYFDLLGREIPHPSGHRYIEQITLDNGKSFAHTLSQVR